MITVLTGTNSFQVRQHAHKLISAFVAEHGNLALEKLEGQEATYDQILGAIESLPFLASKKMVVVDELSSSKEASEQLETLFTRAGDSTDLIIVESKLDKRLAYYKQLKKLPGFHEYNELEEHQLVDWLVAEATVINANLSRTDAQYLVQRVGANQMRLSREIEKLANYNQTITRETINLLTDENPSSTIFNLVDNIFSGDLKKAIRMYDEQRMQKIEPQAILGMLVWQMHAVAIAASASRSISHTQIAKESGISPFVIQKSQRIARNMSRAKIIAFMKLLRDIDYHGKHEPLDYDDALRYAIVSLAY